MSSQPETITLPGTNGSCRLCEAYADRERQKPVVIMACEGACLRGELARLAANFICDEVAPDHTARICLGGAFTKNAGQRHLARQAPRVVAIEGCPIDCGSRMMQAVLPDLSPEIFHLEGTRFDPNLFSIREMPEAERKHHAQEVARFIWTRVAASPSGA